MQLDFDCRYNRTCDPVGAQRGTCGGCCRFISRLAQSGATPRLARGASDESLRLHAGRP